MKFFEFFRNTEKRELIKNFLEEINFDRIAELFESEMRKSGLTNFKRNPKDKIRVSDMLFKPKTGAYYDVLFGTINFRPEFLKNFKEKPILEQEGIIQVVVHEIFHYYSSRINISTALDEAMAMLMQERITEKYFGRKLKRYMSEHRVQHQYNVYIRVVKKLIRELAAENFVDEETMFRSFIQGFFTNPKKLQKILEVECEKIFGQKFTYRFFITDSNDDMQDLYWGNIAIIES